MNINYQNILDDLINNLKNKSKLLLHACCAPCSTTVLEYLADHFDITIYYYNPNIDTNTEFSKRVIEEKELIKKLGLDIKVIETDYNPDEFYKTVKGLESEPEGGKRCYECYKLRLENTVKYAIENDFEYFGTTLSVSPYKNSKYLNEIGKQLSESYNIPYLYSDFKKKNGYLRSIELSKKYGLYRQDYCGCIYSKEK